MKRRLIALLVASFMVSTVSGCSNVKVTVVNNKEEEETEESVQEDDTSEADGEMVGMGNPLEEATFEKIVEVTDCMAFLPNDAENSEYFLINKELGEIRFTLAGGYNDMTLRVQKADEFTDISGMYYDWTVEFDDDLYDFECKTLGYRGEEGDVHVCLWYDSAYKVMYSLSAEAPDLDGFDVYAYAMSMFAYEMEIDYPSSDMEVRTGRTEFESYDEIIGLLEGEEAYALVKVKGYEGDVLLVASGVYDYLDGKTMAAIDATPYTMKSNGMVTADSLLTAGGTAYPISIDESGLIYCFGNHSVEESCYGNNGTDDAALMIMKSVTATDFDENGEVIEISGFYRAPEDNNVLEENSVFYEGNEVTEFYDSYDEFAKAEPVNFTAVDGRTAKQ